LRGNINLGGLCVFRFSVQKCKESLINTNLHRVHVKFTTNK